MEHRRPAALQRLLPAPALRRHDDRAVGGLLVAVAAGRGARRGAGRRHLQPGPRRSRPRNGPSSSWPPSCWCSSRRACTSAVDHPFDVLAGLALGIAIPLAAFRLFTPNDVVPVAYRQGKTAHLDVTGRRGEAIRQAVHDQLGLTVTDVKPVGLEGSGGSTPLRLRVEGDPAHDLPVRQALRHEPRPGRPLVQARPPASSTGGSRTRPGSRTSAGSSSTRTTRCGCCATPASPPPTPYGIVEMTPEREYILVTSFIDGASEIGDAEVDDSGHRRGARAHPPPVGRGPGPPRHQARQPAGPRRRGVPDRRVLRPGAPVAVAPGRRPREHDAGPRPSAPTPSGCTAGRCGYFTADDIAEAFAATRGVASPTQLRAMMKQDGRDLIGEFRRLAPERPPHRAAALELPSRGPGGRRRGRPGRWRPSRRSGCSSPAHDLRSAASPDCGTGRMMVLMAQAVPSATEVPCVARCRPAGSWAGCTSSATRRAFWLDSDLGGDRAVERHPRAAGASATSTGATPVASDEIGTERFERPERLHPELRTRRATTCSPGAA